MLRGYRRYIVAVVGCLILTGATQPQSEQGKAKAGQEQQSTVEPRQTQPANTYKPYPDVNQAACYKAQDHDAADLCAQWRAAVAAERAANAGVAGNYINIGSLALSFAGLIGLFITLRLTRRATWAAVEAVRAQIAADRPIVMLDKAHLDPTEDSQPGAVQLQLSWSIINSGRSGCWLETIGLAVEESLDHSVKPVEARINAFLAQDKTVGAWAGGPKWTFDADESAQISVNRKAYLWGHVIYRGASGARWKTGFAFHMDLDGELSGTNISPLHSNAHWHDELITEPKVSWYQSFKWRAKQP